MHGGAFVVPAQAGPAAAVVSVRDHGSPPGRLGADPEQLGADPEQPGSDREQPGTRPPRARATGAAVRSGR
ncbi:MAG: hypothetical protein ABI807_05275 [Sporichthyaceae bacterium]